uniref:Ubiquinone/menaquinone biosynthesis C-methylase UbiE n=1 Tax=Candidatus Kentrum sp. MB TaxID=2138164 RepID=A0A450Y1W4_9GAMM|nr:MAG: Ubiquinone/menaquinone biosynthesis C-methylase UbiE [Candidatus Kentron sp. MB]VFK35534.1 MAG: Ubiquinone/menaquinone biosynthesis C-methylase UbiE [Candidatus Kentron sp. MB]VFK77336.1 MAG: Ubiquinone/menaquinone biosynthesis C-methylase UbiE [Candidatus Kentron sp. MB]
MKTEYENYDETSKVYDDNRIPVGIEIILGCFASTPRLLSEQKILDAGCGTGSYVYALKDKLGHLYGLELNEGMLTQARNKCGIHANIGLDQGTLLDPLPYRDETFDGVMCNQVLHHLVAVSEQADFTSVNRLVEEARRVLRPQGTLILNTSSHRQLYDGFWWADLIPDAVGRIAERFPSIESLVSILTEAGFRKTSIFVPMDAVMQGKNYLDPMGPLKKKFRDADSTWSLATDEELERAQARVRLMSQNGTMENYLEIRESLRKKTGQVTLIVSYKQ